MLDVQYPEGYWWGELESNTTMEAEFILLTHFLDVADEEKLRKLGNYILSKQREDGTWGQFYGAPGDLSTTTECYFMAGVIIKIATTRSKSTAQQDDSLAWDV